MDNKKVYKMIFGDVYPLLVNKVLRKERSKDEVDEVICWLTGYSEDALQDAIENRLTYEEFFNNAPKLNENRNLITGSICGVKINEIEEPLMKEIRYLDKLVDEIAKGKSMDKILRKPKESNVSKTSDKINTLEKYIENQEEPKREQLIFILDAIREVLPEYEERFSWGMPTFWHGKNIIHVACMKNHIGIYPGPKVVEIFKEELEGFKTSKGAIQIPYCHINDLPIDLIKRIAKCSYENI